MSKVETGSLTKRWTGGEEILKDGAGGNETLPAANLAPAAEHVELCNKFVSSWLSSDFMELNIPQEAGGISHEDPACCVFWYATALSYSFNGTLTSPDQPICGFTLE